MLLYILKFSACLFTFIAFYKVFLEQTSYNKFKRFYLIFALLSAICIPLITFTSYVEIQTEINNFAAVPLLSEGAHHAILTEAPTNYLSIILWSIYGIGVFVFSIKFLRNLVHIASKIKANPKYKNSNFINVLLQDLVAPHTFFSYIFLNKTKFENNEIPKEVLLHEETHAKQKHSIDVLIIEVIQILFWFNPLIYLIKKDIKLNHEFLADEAVINHGAATVAYQELLLAFSSNASDSQLANAINYSSIKKRLTVMKTHTKKTAIWLRSLVLMPLLALLVYSFSSTELVEKEIQPSTSAEHATPLSGEVSNERHTARSITIEVLDNGQFTIDNYKATKETFVAVINTLHQDVSPEIRQKIMNIHVNSSSDISNKDIWFIYNSLLDYGFHRMVTPNQEIVLSKGNTPFALENTMTQKGASKEQMAEYNKLAKHYNSMSKNNMTVYLKDVERMKYIYGLMSKKQRDNAEPFPDFPEPPPAPDAPSVSDIPPTPPLPPNATPEQKKSYERAIKEYNTWRATKIKEGDLSNIPPPPPPPEPKDPLDHVIEMAKKGATFYLNDKKVTSDQAIDALKRNKSLNVQTIGHSSKQPKVYIQTKPIHIKNKKGLPKPTAENIINHIKVMDKRNAKFYLNNTKISYKEALAYVKKNRNADVSTSMESNVVIIDKKEKQSTSQNSISPKTGFINVNGKKLYYTNVNNKITYYNRYGVVTDKNGKELNPNAQTNASDVLPNSTISKVYQNNKIISEFKNTDSNNYNDTPSMLQLANKGAVFYFEEKEISGKKAIELTDDDNTLNILIKNIDSRKPIVKLSTKPIRI